MSNEELESEVLVHRWSIIFISWVFAWLLSITSCGDRKQNARLDAIEAAQTKEQAK